MTVLELLMQEFIEEACVTEDADLEAVTDRLVNCDTGAIAVFSATGQLVGMISDRELVKALSSRSKCNSLLVAGDVMSRDVVTCTPEQADIDLLLTMAEKRVRHLPVVIGKHS